jgi:hypothetical protein
MMGLPKTTFNTGILGNILGDANQRVMEKQSALYGLSQGLPGNAIVARQMAKSESNYRRFLEVERLRLAKNPPPIKVKKDKMKYLIDLPIRESLQNEIDEWLGD